MKKLMALLLVFLFLCPFSVGAQEKTIEGEDTIPDIVVDNFDKGRTMGLFSERSTTLGTFHGTWAKRPSWTVITKSPEEKRGKRGLGLVIEYEKKEGWCGWYTLLDGLDTTSYNTLSFWVKGAEGAERFDIGLADKTMQDLEIDAVYAGPIMSFVPEGGVTTEWQQAKVPLAKIGSEIDLSSMGSIVFWFKYEGKGKVFIDDVVFTNDPEITKIADYNYPSAKIDPESPRSLWVWKIDPILNLRQRKELFKLCERIGITILYLYFGASPQEEGEENANRAAQFFKECHQKGIKVEALTGNPVWSLKEYHHVALDWVKGFLEFNKGRPEIERIDGVSLDVEPYLTQEWTTKKEVIKKDYIEFLKDCRKLIDSYKQHFIFGMAIPLFYDREEAGEFERKIFEYIDYAALMDYYDTEQEVIEKARFHIDLAKKMGKSVTIGVETQNLVEMKQGKPRNTFYEEGWEEMERILEETAKAFKGNPAYGGIAIHCYYSYRLLTRGRNVPTRERPDDVYTIASVEKGTKKVKIDGDLSEWNLSSPFKIEYQENVVYGKGGWFGFNDLSAKFHSMWDKEALYFAFEIMDDSVIQEGTGANMWEGDHVEFWIDADLLSDYNEAMNSNDDYQFGFSPGNFGSLKPEVIIWTPTVKDELRDKIEVAAKKTKEGYNMEVRLPAEVIFREGIIRRVGVEPKAQDPTKEAKIHYSYKLKGEDSLKLKKGLKIGVSIDPSDQDKANVPQESLMSSSTNRVWGDPTTFGFLELK
jgi:hypothetical protein